MAKQVPTLGVIVLVIGILWLAKDLGWIRINIPWVPILLIIIGAGMIYKKWNI